MSFVPDVSLADQEKLDSLAHLTGYGNHSVGWLLYGLARCNGARNVVQTGYDKGYSALMLAAGMVSGGRLVSVDILPCDEGLAVSESKLPIRHFFLQGDSANMVGEVTACLEGDRIDMLFIDGGHSFKCCLSDWEIFSPLVSNNGIVLFHDNQCAAVRDVIKRIREWDCVDIGGMLTLCRRSKTVIDVMAGHAWQRDASDAIVYDSDYWHEYVKRSQDALDGPINQHRASLARRWCPRVLDIGIGCGRFVETWTAQSGFCRGYDINPHAERWLRDRNLWHDLPKDGMTEFDGTSLWDVIEHIPDPAGLLCQLLPGQVAMLTLPIFPRDDFEGLYCWKHFKPREHLHYWTNAGLIAYFIAIGFSLLHTDDEETRCGRQDIRSYVFKRDRPGVGS